MTRRFTEVVGGLTCRVVRGDADAPPRLGVMLCHGYGAPGEDLVPIATQLAHAFPRIGREAVFVFPAAPISMGGFGAAGGGDIDDGEDGGDGGPIELQGFGAYEPRAWWPLDPVAIEAAVTGGRPIDRRSEVIPQMSRIRESLTAVLSHCESTFGLPVSRMVVGGFSQGAMVATDLALHLPESPAGLCIFSGSLLDESTWRRRAPERRGLAVLQSHGRRDPLLSFRAAEDLRDLLSEAGADVGFLAFDGEHTIPMEAMRAFAEFLEERLEEESGGRP